LKSILKNRGFEPRTLGVTDYDMQEPLTAIRRLMLESNGLLTIAFRRGFIKKVRVNLKVILAPKALTYQINGLPVHIVILSLLWPFK
jgi:hypothetical protein